MKRAFPLLFAGLVLSLVVGSIASAEDAPAKKTKAVMHTYLIESPHTAEECLKALDGVAAMGSKALKTWSFGCESGEHTGWAIVQAADEKSALEMVPADLRDKAHAHMMGKFTADQIKQFHSQKM